ncbi:MAG: Phosphatidylinositol mannoside acyltransferase [Deltaproteobacteria bacterium ADurb.Bin510]|nr:MAG: Phosphatidylinositol mannoside acyltransferase [Deltaproteobacteria bacterium ADurb.Bin510]
MDSDKRRRRIRRQLKNQAYPYLARITPAALKLLGRLSRNQIKGLADHVSSLWYRLSPASRQLGLANLDIAYGSSLTPQAKAMLLKKSIASSIRAPLEFHYYACRPQELDKDLLIAEDVSHKLEQILSRSHGAIILTAHFGNWELLNAALRRFAPISIVSRRQKQFDRFVTADREVFGVNTEHDDQTSAQQLCDRLRNGELVEVVMDRNVSHAKGVVVPFMGQPAFTPYFAVNLALYAGVPVIPAFLVDEGQLYRLKLGDPIEIEPLETKTATYRHYCTVFNQTLSQAILAQPEKWFWAHKRWSRPKGEVRAD